MNKKHRKSGFTLIEISIVIVIIGLVVGGILIGGDLISAAKVRAQISQIQKLNLAANAFKLKYGYLPGDIPDPHATSLGLSPRLYPANQGNGQINGHWSLIEAEGSAFWSDLSIVGLVGERFLYVTDSNFACKTGEEIKDYLPKAKLGTDSTYIYVTYNGDAQDGTSYLAGGNDINRYKNYFGIGYVTEICGYNINGDFGATDILRVFDAYNVDKKIDDGLPQSGKVMARRHSSGYSLWSGGNYFGRGCPPMSGACAAAATTCYDDGGVPTGARQYSVGYNQGNNITCGLWFEFQ